MKQDELLIKLFNEVAYVWPRVGYPPLVTPFSQYVKNLSMMNVIAMEKGKERWGMIADDIGICCWARQVSCRVSWLPKS